MRAEGEREGTEGEREGSLETYQLFNPPEPIMLHNIICHVH